MLESHINAIEKVLLAQSDVAKNSGHPNLRGGPREWFIKEFLESHLPSTLEIGQGEIIDKNSTPNPRRGNYRPQIDVVIYRRDLPKISYSKSDIAYFYEGVLAVIESKSVLNYKELDTTNIACKKHSNLVRGSSIIQMGGEHKMYSYLVAFDGPANMSTIADWMQKQVVEEGMKPDEMVDFVVVLGKGILWRIDSFKNLPLNGSSSNFWAFKDLKEGSLYFLFIHMLTWCNSSSSPRNTMGYAEKFELNNISFK